ncbi:MAG: DinB family protein [Chloroflexota bacterium]
MTVHRRLAPLLSQFDFGSESLLERVAGMKDEEYFWEPVEGCWSVRRHDEGRGVRILGRGDWGLEYEPIPHDSPEPSPFTTIAWRVAHLASATALRADWTVGSKSLLYDDFEMPSSATAGIAALEDATAAWREALTTATTDTDLDQIGRSEFPVGLDPDMPFIEIAWWVNKELIHHGAEIALLRDLWAAKSRA